MTLENEPKEAKTHTCVGGVKSTNPTWIEYDGQNIPLGRVCVDCRPAKLAKFRPEILKPYTQADIDEPLDEDP